MVIVPAREDVEVLHALQTMSEQFQLCEGGIVVLETASLFGKNAWIKGFT
jgi:hypothetical protein